GNTPFVSHAAPLTRIEHACAAVVALSALFALLHALAPVTAWDAASAHAALPADYARAGRIAFNEGQVYTAYPQALHALWGFAYWTGGERDAALTAWALALLSVGAMFGLGHALAGRATAWLAAAAWATTPIFVNQAGTFSLDV